MPGFQILGIQSEGEKNVPRPVGVIYRYTWDMEKLVSESVAQEDSLIYLRTCTLPAYNIETEDVKTGHTTYKLPKDVTWADVKLSFYDTNGLLGVLQRLKDNVWTPEDGIKLADDFVADTKINVNAGDGQLEYSWVLKNSWVRSVSFTELSYEASGVNNVNVTVGYSWAESTPA